MPASPGLPRAAPSVKAWSVMTRRCSRPRSRRTR
jgi:hypothetical protein